jgi:hypothetical protein
MNHCWIGGVFDLNRSSTRIIRLLPIGRHCRQWGARGYTSSVDSRSRIMNEANVQPPSRCSEHCMT